MSPDLSALNMRVYPAVASVRHTDGMPDMPWVDAIKLVLSEQGEPMRASEIAQTIVDKKYRVKVGATPNTTVGSILSQPPLRDEVEKVERGIYRYPPSNEVEGGTAAADGDAPPAESGPTKSGTELTQDEPGLLNAFGLFWRRAEVDWTAAAPKLFGVQLAGSTAVDFGSQAGIYVLYDGSRLVYVGRVNEPRLAKRLREHTRDRLSGRWDRFSWFGVRAVTDTGLADFSPSATVTLDSLINTLEALFIEALEPPQNRRQGDGFAELEFIQVLDPGIEKKRKKQILDELSKNL